MKRLLLAVLTLLPITLASATDLGRVTLKQKADIHGILIHGFDVVNVHPTLPGAGEGAPPAVDILLHGNDLQELVRLGFRVDIIQKDMEGHFAQKLSPLTQALSSGPPNFGQGSMGGYYTYTEIVSVIDHYVTTYPNIVSQKQAIGSSHEGRTLWAFKISDNPNATENEPRVLFDALHHAREPMSAHTLLWLVDSLTAGYGTDSTITQLVDNREIWFIPCVNPDGYVYNQTTNPNGGGLWRKNRRNNSGSCEGVDLNRNWPTAWGIDNSGSSNDTCSEVYRGPSPASEPEISAVNSFMTGKNFGTAWSMHTYGEWLVEPYGYVSASPGPAYAEYSADMAAFNGYTAGVGYDLLYPANGVSVDHYNDAHGAVAYTPEIGTSFWPPVSEAVPTAILNLEPGLLMVKYAGSWINVLSTSMSEVSGNGNGNLDAGETGGLVVSLRSKGQNTATNVTLTITTTDPSLVIAQGSVNLGNLASLTNVNNSGSPLTFQVSGSSTPGTSATLNLEIAYDGIAKRLAIPVDIGSKRRIYHDDLEVDLGWTAGAAGDGAATGIWVRANPNQVIYQGETTQPANDATAAPGTLCFVTGNDASSAGSDDVDGDKTTLTTSSFDLSSAPSAYVRYQRHYFTNGGDPFAVSISNDDGQNWVSLENLTSAANQWTETEFRVSDFVVPSSQMRLRFVAQDEPNNSIVEAAIDELEVVDYSNTPHLGAIGKIAPGHTFELQLAGTPGGLFILFLSPGTGSATIGGVQGTFGLDASVLFTFPVGSVPSDGHLRLPLSVPNDGALVGLNAYFQAIVNTPPYTLSNVSGITVASP